MMFDVPTSYVWRALQPVYRQAWLGTAIALATVAIAATLIVVRLRWRSTSNGHDTVLARITSPTGARPDFTFGRRFRTAWVVGLVSALLLVLVGESFVTLREGQMVSPLLAVPPLVTLSAFLWAFGMRVMRGWTAAGALQLAAFVGALTGFAIFLNLRRAGIPAGFVVFCGIAGAGAVLGVLSEVRLLMATPVDPLGIDEPMAMQAPPVAVLARRRIR